MSGPEYMHTKVLFSFFSWWLWKEGGGGGSLFKIFAPWLGSSSSGAIAGRSARAQNVEQRLGWRRRSGEATSQRARGRLRHHKAHQQRGLWVSWTVLADSLVYGVKCTFLFIFWNIMLRFSSWLSFVCGRLYFEVLQGFSDFTGTIGIVKSPIWILFILVLRDVNWQQAEAWNLWWTLLPKERMLVL